MSASDAAPLPRLGEVFFDVRGNTRSMRLSWYADTGVAVFSIWQGGMCTGTFRLPIGDLPRMVEILQRGPQGRGPADAGSAAQEPPGSRYEGQPDYPTGSIFGPPGGYGEPEEDSYPPADRTSAVRPMYRRDEQRGMPPASYPAEPHPAARGGYDPEDLAGSRPGAPLPDEPTAHWPDVARGLDLAAGRGEPGYGRDRMADTASAEPYGEPAPGYRQEEYGGPEAGGHGRNPYPDEPYPGYQPGYPADFSQGGHARHERGDPAMADDRPERFVPPYVRTAQDDYRDDIPGGPQDLPNDTGGGSYRDGPRSRRSRADEYPEPEWGRAGYSDRPQYR